MRRSPSPIFDPESDEAMPPTRDLLQAAASAMRGDRKGIKAVLSKAQRQLEKRVRHEIRAAGRSKPGPNGQKPKITGARLSPPEPMPAMAAAGVLTMRLPNGRKTRLVVTPAVARHHDLSALRRVGGANTRKAYSAIAHNGRAIDRLAAVQRQLAQRLTKLQSSGDLALLRGILDGLSRLEHRVEATKHLQDKALVRHKRSVRKQLASQAHTLSAQGQAAQIQKLNEAAASVQTAAFGSKGSLLAPNNLLLMANQLGWGFVSEILQALGLAKPGTTSPLVWLAPLASLLTSQVVLGGRQHERFVSGIVDDFVIRPTFSLVSAAVPTGRIGEAKLSLRSYIAPAEWEDFAKRTDVPVTTVVLEPPPSSGISFTTVAEVRKGILSVRIGGSSLPQAVVIAWTVDTRRPNGQ
jgi:hypothetical protein